MTKKPTPDLQFAESEGEGIREALRIADRLIHAVAVAHKIPEAMLREGFKPPLGTAKP